MLHMNKLVTVQVASEKGQFDIFNFVYRGFKIWDCSCADVQSLKHTQLLNSHVVFLMFKGRQRIHMESIHVDGGERDYW